jgi:hypothetical protein
MSTLVAQTISNGTVSTSSANVIQGSARAWVKGSVSGGVPTINGSYNVSSITKVSGGIFTFTLTNAMPNANYSVVANGSSDTDNVYPASSYTNPFSYPSTTTTYTVYWFTGGVGVRDPASINTAIFSS